MSRILRNELLFDAHMAVSEPYFFYGPGPNILFLFLPY